MARITTHLNQLKKLTYGKHIVARVEKLLVAGNAAAVQQVSQPFQIMCLLLADQSLQYCSSFLCGQQTTLILTWLALLLCGSTIQLFSCSASHAFWLQAYRAFQVEQKFSTCVKALWQHVWHDVSLSADTSRVL